MTPVLTLGDTALPFAAALGTAHTTTRASVPNAERVRAIVAFADLRGLTRHDAKIRLKELARDALAEASRRPQVRHLVFAVTLPAPHTAMFDRVASALGARLHADLERERGRDVEITFLDVSGCDDATLLAERLLDRSDDPVSRNGVVVLDWDDVRNRTIARAATAEYL